MAKENPIEDLFISLETLIEPKAWAMLGAVTKIITGARELSNSVQEQQKPKATAPMPAPETKVSQAVEAAVVAADARTSAYFEKPDAPVMGRVEINGRVHDMLGAGNIVVHGNTVFIDGVRHDLDCNPTNDIMEVRVIEGVVGNVIAMMNLSANRIYGNATVYGEASVGAISGDATVMRDLSGGSITGNCCVEGDASVTSVAGSIKVGGSLTIR